MFINRNSNWKVTTEHVFEQTPWKWSEDCNVFTNVGGIWLPDIHNELIGDNSYLGIISGTRTIAKGQNFGADWSQPLMDRFAADERAFSLARDSSTGILYASIAKPPRPNYQERPYIRISYDNGNSWSNPIQTYDNYALYDKIFAKNNEIFLAEISNSATAAFSLNGGASFQESNILPPGDGGRSDVRAASFSYTHDFILLCGRYEVRINGRDNRYARGWVSTDKGRTFKTAPIGFSGQDPITSVGVCGDVAIAGMDGKLSKSTDFGETWSFLPSYGGVTYDTYPTVYGEYIVTDGLNTFIVFFNLSNGNRWRSIISEDRGHTWRKLPDVDIPVERTDYDIKYAYLQGNQVILGVYAAYETVNHKQFMSEDKGQSYKPLPEGLNTGYAGELLGITFLVNPDEPPPPPPPPPKETLKDKTVIMSLSDSASIYITTDGCNEWVANMNALWTNLSRYSVSALKGGANFLIGCVDAFVSKSDPKGSVWSGKDVSLGKKVKALSLNENRVVAVTQVNAVDTGIHLSSDAGDSFNLKDTKKGLDLLDNFKSTFVITYEGSSDIEVSTDNGNAWSLVSTGISTPSFKTLKVISESLVLLSASDKNSLYIYDVVEGKLIATKNGLGLGEADTDRIVGLAYSEGIIIAAYDTGFAGKSLDNGLTWIPLPRYFNNDAAPPETVYHFTTFDNIFVVSFYKSFISVSEDGGDTWVKAKTPLPPTTARHTVAVAITKHGEQ